MPELKIDLTRIHRTGAPKKSAPSQTSTEVGKSRADFTCLSSARTKLRPADVLHLQRTIGNAAVQRMLSAPQGAIQRDFTFADIDYTQERLGSMSLDELKTLRVGLQKARNTAPENALAEVEMLIQIKADVPQISMEPAGAALSPSVTPAAKEAQAVQHKPIITSGFEAFVITKETAGPVLAIMNEWVTQGKLRGQSIEQMSGYSGVKNYKEMSDSPQKEALKPEYRRLVRDLRLPVKNAVMMIQTLYNDIKSEIDNLPQNVSDQSMSKGKSFYLAVKRDGQLKGVIGARLEDGKSGKIDTLAKNPLTIATEKEVKGVARALMTEAIVRLRDLQRMRLGTGYELKPFELVAMDNRVKKIYDHYGFKIKGGMGGKLLDYTKRAERGMDTDWHVYDKMQLPLEKEAAFTGHDPKTGEKVPVEENK